MQPWNSPGAIGGLLAAAALQPATIAAVASCVGVAVTFLGIWVARRSARRGPDGKPEWRTLPMTVSAFQLINIGTGAARDVVMTVTGVSEEYPVEPLAWEVFERGQVAIVRGVHPATYDPAKVVVTFAAPRRRRRLRAPDRLRWDSDVVLLRSPI